MRTKSVISAVVLLLCVARGTIVDAMTCTGRTQPQCRSAAMCQPLFVAPCSNTSARIYVGCGAAATCARVIPRCVDVDLSGTATFRATFAFGCSVPGVAPVATSACCEASAASSETNSSVEQSSACFDAQNNPHAIGTIFLLNASCTGRCCDICTCSQTATAICSHPSIYHDCTSRGAERCEFDGRCKTQWVTSCALEPIKVFSGCVAAGVQCPSTPTCVTSPSGHKFWATCIPPSFTPFSGPCCQLCTFDIDSYDQADPVECSGSGRCGGDNGKYGVCNGTHWVIARAAYNVSNTCRVSCIRVAEQCPACPDTYVCKQYSLNGDTISTCVCPEGTTEVRVNSTTRACLPTRCAHKCVYGICTVDTPSPGASVGTYRPTYSCHCLPGYTGETCAERVRNVTTCYPACSDRQTCSSERVDDSHVAFVCHCKDHWIDGVSRTGARSPCSVCPSGYSGSQPGMCDRKNTDGSVVRPGVLCANVTCPSMSRCRVLPIGTEANATDLSHFVSYTTTTITVDSAAITVTMVCDCIPPATVSTVSGSPACVLPPVRNVCSGVTCEDPLARCIPSEEGPRCVCPAGMAMSTGRCYNRTNSCPLSCPQHQICINKLSFDANGSSITVTPTCVCRAPLWVADPSNATNCVCRSGFTGDHCLTPVDPCDGVRCEGVRVCEAAPDGTAQCVCPVNFGGLGCQIHRCQGVVCLHGTRCIEGVCVCPEGFHLNGTKCRPLFGRGNGTDDLNPRNVTARRDGHNVALDMARIGDSLQALFGPAENEDPNNGTALHMRLNRTLHKLEHRIQSLLQFNVRKLVHRLNGTRNIIKSLVIKSWQTPTISTTTDDTGATIEVITFRSQEPLGVVVTIALGGNGTVLSGSMVGPSGFKFTIDVTTNPDDWSNNDAQLCVGGSVVVDAGFTVSVAAVDLTSTMLLIRDASGIPAGPYRQAHTR
eukprot:m51a1_g14075 hypothetical protein (941) ;mRNA; r:1290529-1294208